MRCGVRSESFLVVTDLGQAHVRDIDAELNAGTRAEDTLHADADVETTTAQLLQTKPGGEECARATRPASAEDAASVPRQSRR